jgi:hypothetical protein
MGDFLARVHLSAWKVRVLGRLVPSMTTNRKNRQHPEAPLLRALGEEPEVEVALV